MNSKLNNFIDFFFNITPPYYFLMFSVLILIIFIIIIIIYYRNVKIVKRYSIKYKALIELNEKTHFNKISQNYYIYSKTKRLSSYKCFDHKKNLINKIIEDKNFYSNLISSVKENNNKWSVYNSKIQNLPPYMHELKSINVKISQLAFFKIEKKIIKDNILKSPVLDPNIIYKVSYTSPAGKKSYSTTWTIPFCNLINYYNSAEKTIEYQQTAKYERQKLSASLRYKILKRDGFKCKLCGRKSEDGVELEVDHIIPVSKGGKTIESNLRTLCKDCNRGKSNKFE